METASARSTSSKPSKKRRAEESSDHLRHQLSQKIKHLRDCRLGLAAASPITTFDPETQAAELIRLTDGNIFFIQEPSPGLTEQLRTRGFVPTNTVGGETPVVFVPKGVYHSDEPLLVESESGFVRKFLERARYLVVNGHNFIHIHGKAPKKIQDVTALATFLKTYLDAGTTIVGDSNFEKEEHYQEFEKITSRKWGGFGVTTSKRRLRGPSHGQGFYSKKCKLVKACKDDAVGLGVTPLTDVFTAYSQTGSSFVKFGSDHWPIPFTVAGFRGVSFNAGGINDGNPLEFGFHETSLIEQELSGAYRLPFPALGCEYLLTRVETAAAASAAAAAAGATSPAVTATSAAAATAGGVSIPDQRKQMLALLDDMTRRFSAGSTATLRTKFFLDFISGVKENIRTRDEVPLFVILGEDWFGQIYTELLKDPHYSTEFQEIHGDTTVKHITFHNTDFPRERFSEGFYPETSVKVLMEQLFSQIPTYVRAMHPALFFYDLVGALSAGDLTDLDETLNLYFNY